MFRLFGRIHTSPNLKWEKMKSIALVPMLVAFFLVFVFDSCEGAFINPNFLLKGNEGLNAVSQNFNPMPSLDFGNVKSNSWPSNVGLGGGSQKFGVNVVQGNIGGTVWQNKDKGLSMDLDLQPSVVWKGGNVNPSLNALGDLKKTWPIKGKDLSFDLDLKPGLAWRPGNIKPSFDALGTFKWNLGK